uniref:Uncharacterized protein n=1 Tax=Rhizophora mucronata TaxID=61149 RepID=A0A2P2K5Q6_RHIMU
MNHLQDPN